MSLTLDLAPEIEAALRDEAERSGRSPEELASEAVSNRFRGLTPRPKLTPEEWVQQATAWIEGHRRWPVLTDSAHERESFYGDRG